MTRESQDGEVVAIVRELATDPRISAVWTEITPQDHRIWLARGANGHPWLLASDSLKRFRQMIDGLAS